MTTHIGLALIASALFLLPGAAQTDRGGWRTGTALCSQQRTSDSDGRQIGHRRERRRGTVA